jgi:hypothetical protein
MKFIQGHNRTQINLFPVSPDQSIDPENEVRMIDLFVDSLSIKDFGFRTDFIENGHPAYHPEDLLRLFMKKECKRNRNRINYEAKEHLYKRRQVIVENPYGTLKRQWGFNYRNGPLENKNQLF